LLQFVASTEGLGICSEAFAQNDASVHLAGPLNPPNLLVAMTTVEFNEMRCLFGSVHGELNEASLSGPMLGTLKEHAADARSLVLWVDSKLVYSSNPRACEVLALIFSVGWLGNDCSDESGADFGDEAFTTSNSLSSDIGCLIDCCVVQTHVTELSVGSMKQRREVND
jgi:hypothetical protein